MPPHPAAVSLASPSPAAASANALNFNTLQWFDSAAAGAAAAQQVVTPAILALPVSGLGSGCGQLIVPTPDCSAAGPAAAMMSVSLVALWNTILTTASQGNRVQSGAAPTAGPLAWSTCRNLAGGISPISDGGVASDQSGTFCNLLHGGARWYRPRGRVFSPATSQIHSKRRRKAERTTLWCRIRSTLLARTLHTHRLEPHPHAISASRSTNTRRASARLAFSTSSARLFLGGEGTAKRTLVRGRQTARHWCRRPGRSLRDPLRSMALDLIVSGLSLQRRSRSRIRPDHGRSSRHTHALHLNKPLRYQATL